MNKQIISYRDQNRVYGQKTENSFEIQQLNEKIRALEIEKAEWQKTTINFDNNF